MQTTIIGEEKKITADDVRKALHSKFRADQYLKIEEFDEFNTGRRIDFMAVSLVRSRPGIHGIEIKVARSDWLKEMHTAKKADAFYFCDYYYLASPPGIWQNGEVPEGWGIYEFQGNKIKLIRNPLPLPSKYDFVFLRTLMGRTLTPESSALTKARVEGYNSGYQDGQKSIKPVYELNNALHELQMYKENFEKFKVASGIDLNSIWHLGDIGKIVGKIQMGMNAEKEYAYVKDQVRRAYERLGELKEFFEKETSN